jgi:hypothetical protein
VSGAACFWDGNLIDPSSSPFIANDSNPEELDAIDLADESHVAYAGRKTVDLLRKAARNEDGSLLANVAIPTLVYGRGVGYVQMTLCLEFRKMLIMCNFDVDSADLSIRCRLRSRYLSGPVLNMGMQVTSVQEKELGDMVSLL